MKRLFGVLGGVALGGAVFLLSAELLMRLFYYGPDAIFHLGRYTPLDCSKPYFLRLSENPRVEVELRSDHGWYFLGKKRWTNSLGLADGRLPEDFGSVPTMIVMGESFAEGAGVEMSDRFSARMEDKLRERRKINVVNMAITNATLESQIELLKWKVIPRYHPKWVVVSCLVFRDIGNSDLRRSFWPKRIRTATALFPLWKRSFALYILRDYWTSIDLDKNWFKTKLRKIAGGSAPVRREDAAGIVHLKSSGKAEQLFAELKQLGKENDFEIILAPLSYLKELDNPHRDQSERTYLKKLAEELSIPYIDTFGYLTGLDPRYCILWASNRHPNKFCHELLADGLARDLISKGLLTVEDRPAPEGSFARKP